MNYWRDVQILLIRLMKWTAVLWLIVLLDVGLIWANPGMAQEVLNQKITLSAEGQPIRAVLRSLEQQAGTRFMYRQELLNTEQRVNLRVNGERLADVLDKMLKPFELRYEVLGKRILLTRASDNSTLTEPASLPSSLPPANQRVSGRVTDAETKEGLPGVSVVVKGTNQGTTTDAGGSYQIDVPTPASMLVFSFVGYDRQEVKVGNQTALNITLQPVTGSLAEVVVVGYGQQKRANLTGAVATIESKEIKQSPVADLSNAVVGRVPGLIATQRSGEPGSDGSSLLIRGVSTSGDNTPLYVIDGIPRQPSDFSQLDPNEIETFTILKDASSSAVFGVRGANGVVLVTTKRGKSGKTGFSYTASYGLQQPTRLPEFLGSYDYAVLYNEAKRNEGKPELYTANDLQKFKDGSDPLRHPNTDWFKEVLKPVSPQMQHNLNVNGGGERSRYFVSMGYLNQKGLYETVGFKRYNLRTNIDADVTKTTTISLDISGRVEDRHQPGVTTENIFAALVRTPPTFSARYPNGLLANVIGNNSGLGNALESGYRKDTRTVILSRLTINQRLPFVEGLGVRGIVSVDKGFTYRKNFILSPQYYQLTDSSTYVAQGVSPPTLGEEFYQYQSITAEAHLTYARTFGKHDFSGLLLYTQNVTGDNVFTAFRNNYPSTAIEQISAGDAKNQQTTGNATKTTRQGYVGRLNYAYDGKYLLEANFRYDGSDNFAPGKKFGFFPSVSVGWVFSQENFIRDRLRFVDFAKLRFSHGKLGNDRLRDPNGVDVRRYPYLSTYNFGNDYVLGGSSPAVVKGLTENGLSSPNTTWETATKTDIGLEARLLKGKVSVEIDYFYQRRSGILGTRNIAVPALLGATLPVENISIIDNSGVEFSVGYQGKVGSGLSYHVRGNSTFVKNKVIFIDEPASTNPLRQLTGRPLNQFVGLEVVGLFQTDEEIKGAPVQFGNTNLKPGDIRYRDINGDGKIDNDDRTAIGRSNIPQIIYGLSVGAAYQGFYVDALVQGSGQVNQYLSEEAAFAFFNSGKVLKQHLDRWTPTNPNATYPRILTEDSNNRIVSSYWLKNAAYLRLKNVEIGYNVPKAAASKIHAEGIRIYVNGINLLTVSQIKTFDPENANNRAWAYPQQKLYNLGVNIQF